MLNTGSNNTITIGMQDAVNAILTAKAAPASNDHVLRNDQYIPAIMRVRNPGWLVSIMLNIRGILNRPGFAGDSNL